MYSNLKVITEPSKTFLLYEGENWREKLHVLPKEKEIYAGQARRDLEERPRFTYNRAPMWR